MFGIKRRRVHAPTPHPTPTQRQREIAAASTRAARDAAMQPARDKGALDVIAAMLRNYAIDDGGTDGADYRMLRSIEEVVRDSGRNLNPPEWDQKA